MKTIEKKVNYNKYSSKTFDLYFKDKNIAVFDIETTGLYPRRDQVILTGVLTFLKGKLPPPFNTLQIIRRMKK